MSEAAIDEGVAREPDSQASRPSGRRSKPRRRRRRRLFRALVVVLLILAGLVVGLAVYTERQLGDVTRFPFDIDRPGRPARTQGEALNILVAAVDEPEGSGDGPSVYEALERREWTPGVFRSDVIMVLHLPADRSSAQLVSIPRDSYVDIAGHGRSKINAAFSWGGPQLMARTVEDLTGVRIDHAVVVGFAGLSKIADIVGGVDLYLNEPTFNPVDSTTWPAGTHRFTGEEALAYVRERHSLARGDFSRIQRQQNLLRALLVRLTASGTMANPGRLVRLVANLSDAVAVDDGLDNGALRRLALQSRGIRAGDVTFATVPVTGTPTIAGASVVTLNLRATASMFAALDSDRLDDWLADHETDVLPGPREVE
ncbi:MAG TPA: LCP family protein [Nocardioides sp.]|jgi:LCP family protein required for cell wall assembly|nr:LCP family protein [Nocardioides sp.]